MNKLAIRQKIGEWVYYTTAFSFREVVDNIRAEWKEEMGLDNAPPEERLQRELTNNLNKIANYIKNQRDMFFNSLVLAVYDGDPQWREIRIDYGDNEIYDAGILELTINDKIFPVDGQHRVEGIRKVLGETGGHKEANDNYFNNQTVPVILISHDNSKEGKKRTRRLFTTLNRYAKPVNKTDIILLDEDDTVAIATRRIHETVALFKDERLLLSQSKAIPDTDRTSFTNIQVLYDCNIELLKKFLNEGTYCALGDRNARIKGDKNGVEQFIRFRRPDNEINEFIAYVGDFWSAFAKIDVIADFLSDAPQYKYIVSYGHENDDENDDENDKNHGKEDGKEDELFEHVEFDELFLRGPITDVEKRAVSREHENDGYCPTGWPPRQYDEGGNLLFRPVGQVSAVKAAIKLTSNGTKTWEEIFGAWYWIDFSLGYNLWSDIAYSPKAGMIISNNKLIEDLLVYITEPTQFTDNDFIKLVDTYIAKTQRTTREKLKQLSEHLSSEEREKARIALDEEIKTRAINEIKSSCVQRIKEEYS